MNIRVLYNILLVKLHIRSVLPTQAVQRVTLKECGEELIPIPSGSFVILNSAPCLYGRKGVVEKLKKIENELNKQGCRIGIFSFYRDRALQENLRKEEYECVKKEFPGYSQEEWIGILNKRVSNITKQEVGGHQTGAAVDVTLCSMDGTPLDMGTRYTEFNAKTKTRCKALTPQQKKNRKLLCKVMKKEGFANYPNEWWHFSYGDKMWAAYKNRSTAIYGHRTPEL